MPNKSSSWASKSTSSVQTPIHERNFGLRSLAKWGRSRSTHRVEVAAAMVGEESLSTTTTSSSWSTTSLPHNSVVTTTAEGASSRSCRGANQDWDTCHAGAFHDEILQVPSQESTRTDMEEESSVESDSCLDAAGNRKRASSLDQHYTNGNPGMTMGGGPQDHVHKQARATLQESSKTRDRFMSILDRPFQYWHELNMVLKVIHPEWSPYQRGRMIHHLIHFLELKIGKDEYFPTGLLFPTPVVESAWRALVIETTLYLNVIYALQDFHGKDREMIHYTLILNRELSPKDVEDKIRRTQSLFLVYFKEIMPTSIDDEPRHLPPLVPIYHRASAGGAAPTFGTPTKQGVPQGTTIMELSSLSLKDLCGGASPQEDDTASTHTSLFSGNESEGLMGLELLD